MKPPLPTTLTAEATVEEHDQWYNIKHNLQLTQTSNITQQWPPLPSPAPYNPAYMVYNVHHHLVLVHTLLKCLLTIHTPHIYCDRSGRGSPVRQVVSLLLAEVKPSIFFLTGYGPGSDAVVPSNRKELMLCGEKDDIHCPINTSYTCIQLTLAVHE
jgi:hypothetical protein